MTSLALMPVYCNDSPRVTTLTRQWFEDCVGYTAEYLKQQSGGQYTFNWQVVDWFQLPLTSAQWDTAAGEVYQTALPAVQTGLGVNLSGHTHWAFIIDKAGASAAAWHPSKPYLYISAPDFDPALLGHELGHMAGATHSQGIAGTSTPDAYGDSFCIMGGEGNKFRFVEPSLDFRWREGQPEWRSCQLCSGLYYGGNSMFSGVCPGSPFGTGHSFAAGEYLPPFTTNGPGDFRYCSKCAGIVDAAAGPGTCPAGGSHDATGWFFTPRPGSDANSLPEGQREIAWYTCGKCRVLFHDGTIARRCAAGGDHARSGGEKVLVHDVPAHNLAGPGMTIGELLICKWVNPATAPLNETDVVSRRPITASFQIDALTGAPAIGDYGVVENVAGGKVFFEYRHPSGWDRALPLTPDAGDGWVLMHTSTPQIQTLLVAKMPAQAGQNLYLEPLRAHVSLAVVTATDTQRHVTIAVDTLDPPRDSQLNWRRCRKCGCLHYSGFLGKGPCAVGGEHELSGPNYAIPHDVRDGGEPNFRFCPKCQCMFFAGNNTNGRCVADRMPHTAAGFNFSISQTVAGRADHDWQYCTKCECLVFTGDGFRGQCAVGGAHQTAGVRVALPWPRPGVDYDRNAKPLDVRTKATVTAPWIDRTNMLIENATEMHGLQQWKVMQTFLFDAAYLYDEMLRLNPELYGPQLVSGVIRGLSLIGIEFSVLENELRDWLANPEFTPYPALAEALLLLRRRLNKPIFIDVVSAKFEQQPGVSSPRIFADLTRVLLEKAILDAFNENYGENFTNINEISVLA